MNQSFITEEIKKIVENKELPFPLNMAMSAAWILSYYNGFDLKVFNVRSTSSLADFYILSSGKSSIQMQSMVREMIFQYKHYDLKMISLEGRENSEWILLDMGDIIIHIVLESMKNIYDLESLWKDLPQIKIPESYYIQKDLNILSTADNEGYF